MATFQVKVGEHSYVVVADGSAAAMGLALEEDGRREGGGGVVESAKRIKDRVVGMPDDEAQRTLWSAKEG
jgi:hypothetical protein